MRRGDTKKIGRKKYAICDHARGGGGRLAWRYKTKARRCYTKGKRAAKRQPKGKSKGELHSKLRSVKKKVAAGAPVQVARVIPIAKVVGKVVQGRFVLMQKGRKVKPIKLSSVITGRFPKHAKLLTVRGKAIPRTKVLNKVAAVAKKAMKKVSKKISNGQAPMKTLNQELAKDDGWGNLIAEDELTAEEAAEELKALKMLKSIKYSKIDVDGWKKL